MAEDKSGEPKDTEKFVVVPLGGAAKKIAQVVSSDLARRILEVLADAPMSTSQIAEKLSLPLTTIQYNVEKLEDAGLIKVERIRRSEKMREMKLYAPVKKLIVVVPEGISREGVTGVLRKYLAIVFGIVLISGIVEIFSQTFSARPAGMQAAAPMAGELVQKAVPAVSEYARSAAEAEPVTSVLIYHPGLWFLLGGISVIAILVIFEHYRRKRTKS